MIEKISPVLIGSNDKIILHYPIEVYSIDEIKHLTQYVENQLEVQTVSIPKDIDIITIKKE